MKTTETALLLIFLLGVNSAYGAKLSKKEIDSQIKVMQTQCKKNMKTIRGKFGLDEDAVDRFCDCHTKNVQQYLQQAVFENTKKPTQKDRRQQEAVVKMSFNSCMGEVATKLDQIGYPSVADALLALKNNPGSKISAENDWVIIELFNGKNVELWHFTPKAHPATPAAIKRQIVKRDGQIHVDMRVKCEGKKEACDELIAQYEKISDDVEKELRKKKAK